LNRIVCALAALLLLATGWAFAQANPPAPERDIVMRFTSDEQRDRFGAEPATELFGFVYWRFTAGS